MKFKYNINDLKTHYNKTEKNHLLFFYEHETNTPGTIDKSCLSQWYPCSFKYQDFTFQSAEQWMMLQKAIAFNDHNSCFRIMKSKSPEAAKKLGRHVINFNNECWKKYRYEIVVFGNILKFSQNKELGEFLVGTGDKILVEASATDAVWGIGLSENAPGINDINNWKGENMLGFALMEVRDFIREYGFWTDIDNISEEDYYDSNLPEIQDELYDLDSWGLHDYGESLFPLYAKGCELLETVDKATEIFRELPPKNDAVPEIEMSLSNLEENINVIANFNSIPEFEEEPPAQNNELAELETAMRQLTYDLLFLSRFFPPNTSLNQAIQLANEYKTAYDEWYSEAKNLKLATEDRDGL